MKEICSLIECTGCQACKQVCPKYAIQMREDKKGHIYPFINQASCIDCGLCVKHCPSIKQDEKNMPQKVIAGWVKESKVRMASTSGGISYALSNNVVSRGGYFCGVIWDKVSNGTKHEITNKISLLSDFQGSRYSHSDTSGVFFKIKRLLQRNETVLFIGTPCQVGGLKSFLQKDYENLFTVDLICHGVPSRKILRDRIENIEQMVKKKVVNMKSREKTPNQYFTSTQYVYEDGTSVLVSVYKDPFFRCFKENFALRPNCFRCQYAQKMRVADLTIGDFWGYVPHSLKFKSFRKGTSAMLINTNKGFRLFDSIKNDLIWEERSFQEVSSCNRNLSEPQMKPEKYDEFWEKYLSGEQLTDLSSEFFPSLDYRISISSKLKIYLKMLFPTFLLGQLKNDIMNVNTETFKNITRPFYSPLLKNIRKIRKNHFIKNDVSRVRKLIANCPDSQPQLFYLGITAHSNLGDMGQYYCIHNWILQNYPTYKLIEVEADTVVDKRYGFLEFLKKQYDSDDVIVFQSGYTTQDLGGVHDLMHRMVIEALPDARILMMPQTIFFQHEENKLRSSRIYNKAHKMLFLARDQVSYEIAKEMMPDVNVKLFPDIVTSLIGKYKFNHSRHGVSLCRRNDGEKFYSEEELSSLIRKFEQITTVTVSDTTIKVPFKELRSDPQRYIERQIEYFSRFEVVITDRYHGTIFALAAGTPVVIIKTNDHKVVTGADWFKGIYDDYIYVAKDLDDAFQTASSIREKRLDYRLQPIFAAQYYGKLKEIFESEKK